MLRDLFINMLIEISFISIVSQLIKKYEIGSSSSTKIKVITGIITGILGITIMLFGVQVDDNTILDFRNVVLALAAIHGGTIAVIICGLVIALFRVAYFGISSASLLGFSLVIIIIIGCAVIANFKIKTSQKWIYSTVYNLFFSSIIFTILLKDKLNIMNFLLIYWSTTCLVTWVIAHYSDYCLTANSLLRRLQVESTKDFLTGLNNVRNFDNLYNYAIKNAIEKKEKLSLLMIDIDFFKRVNDTYGHAEGDIVLSELGKILTKNSRSFDIVSRNGGEEFTVLLLDCANEHAIQIAERIRCGVETHPFILSTGTQIDITVSIGVASYPEITNEIEKLLEISDIGLYAAKHSGRNKVCSGKEC
ncbi:diguanylate cyclase [Clostridium lacusfryxellense]|uniref:diguanylate cyclase n=1 Tax=Clostridium lacusfryxellense TaxID=205328 RepID=UPI001C0E02CB|nr:diguanylate cyclase [Clostridium lacusfryxellense]MBU3111476.1 GGDEF domain-containing protein [Clostridium lacusfryxellense]